MKFRAVLHINGRPEAAAMCRDDGSATLLVPDGVPSLGSAVVRVYDERRVQVRAVQVPANYAIGDTVEIPKLTLT